MQGSYDFIIAGCGCAGLSLAVHLIHSGKFRDKKILLVDSSEKKENDRTWCFWEKSPGLFESILFKKWSTAWFHGTKGYSRMLHLDPYTYKMIRGIDFYNHCFGLINQQTNISFCSGSISRIGEEEGKPYIHLGERKIYCSYLFNSILFEKPRLRQGEYYLLQHFLGWIIITDKGCFQEDAPTLMDFRTGQQEGTTFGYVLPFSSSNALVEYTLFSKEILSPAEYEAGLRKYINQVLRPSHFEISEREFGIIPMTNHRFKTHEGNIIHVGTAGGQTKASTGYTFRNIQNHSAAIVSRLARGLHPVSERSGVSRRFRFYDSVLLNILSEGSMPGSEIFTTLFKKNKPALVLKFLDNETSLPEETRILATLPTLPFLKAAARHL